MQSSLKVAIACPMEMVRAGIRDMVAGTGIKVIAEAGNAAQLRSLVKQKNPDVLIIDVALPGCVRHDAFDLVAKMGGRLGNASLIFLTAVDNPTYAARARAVGASNCLPLGFSPEELVVAIKNAAQRKPAAGHGAFVAISKTLSTLPTDASERNLTPREQQVLSHLAYGLSNEEIARSLTISVETVKEHVQNVLRKLTVKDRTQAAVWSVRQKRS